jgi:hypothetical protein
VAKLPDRDEQQRRFMALDPGQRRAIVKAVNRGKAVDVRAHAPLAVGVARRQQRFWRWAWLFGPVSLVIQLALVPIEQALVNAGIATIAIGLVSLFYFRRARQSEQLNLAIVEGRRAPGGDKRKGGTTAGGGHLPGAGGRQRSTRDRDEHRTANPAPDAVAGDEGAAPPPPTVPGRSPYRPRGRKRRG